MDANTFEQEQHSDDNLHCSDCGAKIRYCHGDTELCSDCRKGMIDEHYDDPTYYDHAD